MSQNDGSVRFLYGNAFGRLVLKCIQKTHADKIAVAFLRSRLSRPKVRRYVKKHGIEVSEAQLASFRSFQEFFVRGKDGLVIDREPSHLISPCDGWLSTVKLDETCRFAIKGSVYRLEDFLQDDTLKERFVGGDGLIVRLCASDYHHYCYIDDGTQGANHFVEGELNSVQPIACEHVPIYTKNRRSWTALDTAQFGTVIQAEIGALVVGGIVNHKENAAFERGEEKGRFDLCGSTIVLLFEPNRIRLLPELAAALEHEPEVRVTYGRQIGERVN